MPDKEIISRLSAVCASEAGLSVIGWLLDKCKVTTTAYCGPSAETNYYLGAQRVGCDIWAALRKAHVRIDDCFDAFEMCEKIDAERAKIKREREAERDDD